MSVEEAKSVDTDSNKNTGDDEEYETITISEAPMDEERYDKDIDMLEEKQAIGKLKGFYTYTHIHTRFWHISYFLIGTFSYVNNLVITCRSKTGCPIS